MKDEDEALIDHIRSHWRPPEGSTRDFQAAGARVRRRQRRARRLRITTAGLFVVAGVVLSLRFRVRPPSVDSDYLAWTTGNQGFEIELPPEYEALRGTIYGGRR